MTIETYDDGYVPVRKYRTQNAVQFCTAFCTHNMEDKVLECLDIEVELEFVRMRAHVDRV